MRMQKNKKTVTWAILTAVNTMATMMKMGSDRDSENVFGKMGRYTPGCGTKISATGTACSRTSLRNITANGFRMLGMAEDFSLEFAMSPGDPILKKGMSSRKYLVRSKMGSSTVSQTRGNPSSFTKTA